MDFLKKLLGRGVRSPGDDKDGMYFYVRNKRSGEVIRVRLNRSNDLSLMDSGGYYARKLVVGRRSFERIEVEFFFDRNRQFTSADVSAEGELVNEEDYSAQDTMPNDH